MRNLLEYILEKSIEFHKESDIDRPYIKCVYADGVKHYVDKFDGEYQPFEDENDFILEFIPKVLGQKFSIKGRHVGSQWGDFQDEGAYYGYFINKKKTSKDLEVVKKAIEEDPKWSKLFKNIEVK